MKLTLHHSVQPPSEYWNGTTPLPSEITVLSSTISTAEFQLLSILCTLHGKLSPYDLLTGSEPNTEKDRDMIAVLTAFQWYLYPRMPLTGYSVQGQRIPLRSATSRTPLGKPIDGAAVPMP